MRRRPKVGQHRLRQVASDAWLTPSGDLEGRRVMTRKLWCQAAWVLVPAPLRATALGKWLLRSGPQSLHP